MDYYTGLVVGAFLVLFSIFVAGCTEQQRAKSFGGSANIEIPANKKLVNVTWKQAGDLWVLTRDRNSNDIKEVYYFSESSSFGILEGEVKIIEK